MATETVLHLEAGCGHDACADLAHRMKNQLDVPNYTHGMAVMPCPDTFEEWQADHRTARKRAWRSERIGYTFAEVDMSRYADDRHAINTSKQERQGRPMSNSYLRRVEIGRLPHYPCDRHRIHTYGVLEKDTLRAYMTLYRVGELGLVSMILGHGDHLSKDIMYLLFAGMVERQAGQGGWLVYNRWDSGTDGLRYYKARVGFEEQDIAWSLT